MSHTDTTSPSRVTTRQARNIIPGSRAALAGAGRWSKTIMAVEPGDRPGTVDMVMAGGGRFNWKATQRFQVLEPVTA